MSDADDADDARARHTIIVVSVFIGFILTLAVFAVVNSVVNDQDRPSPQPDEGQASTSGRCVGGAPAQKGQAALGLVTYPVNNLDYRVIFKGAKKGYLGVTFTTRRTIEVYVRPCQSAEDVASVIGHEVGHAIDDVYGTNERRATWRAERGIEGRWFGCDRCSDFATPSGDFAEVAAFLFAPPGRFRSKLAAAPDADQLERLRPLFYADGAADATTTTTTTTPDPCHVFIADSCVVP